MFISSTQNVRITPTGDQLSVGMSPLYTTLENKGVIICAYTAPLSCIFEAHLHEMETDNIIETHILFNWLIPNCGIITEMMSYMNPMCVITMKYLIGGEGQG